MQCGAVQTSPVFEACSQLSAKNIDHMLYYGQISQSIQVKLRHFAEQLNLEEGIQWKEKSGHHRKTFEFGISFKKIEEREGIIRIEIPPILVEIREELVKFFEDHLTEKDSSKYENCILTVYSEGDGISAHTDRSYFGPDILGLIILPDSSKNPIHSPSSLQFFHPTSQERLHISEQKGTAFLFQGELRKSWKHELNPVITKRIALQFRTVNEELVNDRLK